MYKKLLTAARICIPYIDRNVVSMVSSKHRSKILLLFFLTILSDNYLSAQIDASSAAKNVLKLDMDKTDYQPGEIANISGSGFQPFEAVSLEVHHADGTPDSGKIMNHGQ